MGIYLLRHIRTVYNIEHRLSGRTDVPAMQGEKLVLPTHPVHFEMILCSPAQRCRETLRLLNDEWGVSEAVIQFATDLQERNLGSLEGMRRADAIAAYPDLFCNGKFCVKAVPPHGESVADVAHRVSTLALQIENYAISDVNILVLAHNQVLKILTAILSKSEITDEYWQKKNYKNGVLYQLDI